MPRRRMLEGGLAVGPRHPDYAASSFEDRNSGKPWSRMDIDDLRDFAKVMTVEELASYLMRPRKEIAEKLPSLKRK